MPIVFGNGGDIVVRHTGEVVGYNPSEEVEAGDHGGYADVIHVDLTEWCRHYGMAPHYAPAMLDILDVTCHLESGTIVEAEPSWRALAEPIVI